MHSLKLLIAATVVLLTLHGCQKDADNRPNSIEPPVYHHLLNAISWDNGMKEEFFYHDDSTLDYVRGSFERASSIVNYTWDGKLLKELSWEQSLYKNSYHYTAEGLLTEVISMYKNDPAKKFYKLEFSYHSNGSVKHLKYFTINESGGKLAALTRYEYKSNGDLHKTITTSDQSVITHVIDSYSEDCEIYPWINISPVLDEFYTIHNYPVQSRLKKYPLKITRIYQPPHQAPETERVELNRLSISNNRIDTLISQVEFPKVPALNRTTEAVFHY